MPRLAHSGSCRCQDCYARRAPHSMHGKIVHVLVGWTAVIAGCVGMLLPAAIYAQQLNSAAAVSPAKPAAVSPQPTCNELCVETVRACAAKAATDRVASAACLSAYRDCTNRCASNSRAVTQAAPKPVEKSAAEIRAEAVMLSRLKAALNPLSVQVSRVRAKLTLLKKRGITPPADAEKAVASVEALIKSLGATASLDQFVAASPDKQIAEAGARLKDELRTIERLSNWSKIVSRIDARILQLDRLLAQDRRLVAKSPIDFSQTLADFESDLKAVKAQYVEIRKNAVTGSAEAAFEQIEKHLLPAIDEVSEHHLLIEQSMRLAPTAQSLERQVAAYQKRIEVIRKRGGEPEKAEAALADLSKAVSALQEAVQAKPVEYKAVMAMLAEIEDMRDGVVAVLDALDEISAQAMVDIGIKVPTIVLPNLNSLLSPKK